MIAKSRIPYWPAAVAIPLAVLAGALATAGPSVAAALLVGTLLFLACLTSRIAPILVLFFVFGVVGTSVDLSSAGVHIPLTVVTLALTGSVAVTRQALSEAREPSSRIARPITFVFVGIILLALLVGILQRNDPGLIRNEVVIWTFGAATLVMTLLLVTPRHLTQLMLGFSAIATLAAGKALWIAATGLTDSSLAGLDANSAVNPGFGSQRVVLVGGDTLIVIGIAVTVGLLRTARSRTVPLLASGLVIQIVAMVVSYTRTSVVAAPMGVLLALILTRSGTGRALRNAVVACVVIGGVALLLIPSYGQSSQSAVGSIVRRFTAGPSGGSGTFAYRSAESQAAFDRVGDDWVWGGGLGATYRYDTGAISYPQVFTHIGYVWLILHGGLVLLAGVVLLACGALGRLGRAALRQRGPPSGAAGAAAGGLLAFLAFSVLVNRFATVEGQAFLGMAIGLGAVVHDFSAPRVGGSRGRVHEQRPANLTAYRTPTRAQTRSRGRLGSLDG
jgi:hypothetical protein